MDITYNKLIIYNYIWNLIKDIWCYLLIIVLGKYNGRGGIRTRDHWLRRPVPYPD